MASRAGTLGLAVVLGLTGCVGGGTALPPGPAALPAVQLTAPVGINDAFADPTPVGTSSAGPVLPLFAMPGIATNYGAVNLLAWGTKDAAGNIGALQEIAIYGLAGSTDNAAVFFDPSGRITSLVDRATGYSVQLAYGGPAIVTATLCDPSLVAVAAVTSFAGSDGTPQGQAVAGGSCAHSNPFALQTGGVPASGAIAATNLARLPDIASLITAGSYVAGIGFAIGALLKFQQHKDNPTQSPLSVPIVYLFVAAGLIFIPAIFRSAGGTDFGTEAGLLGSAAPPFAIPP